MFIVRSLWIFSICILLCAHAVVAQERDAVPAEPSDLSTLLTTIRENNPDLRAAHLEAEVQSFNRSQVTALPDPRIGITYLPYPLFTARGSQRSQWRVEQAIPFPGKLGLKGDIADLGAEIAGLEALTYEQDLSLEGKKTYYELYRIHRQQQLISAFQERLQDFEENASTRYIVGTGMQQAILKAQLERNALTQRELSLEIQQRSALERLSRLMNKPVDGVEIGALQLPDMPALDMDKLLQVALQFRPEAKALDTAEKRTDVQIALTEKAFYPDFGFNVTYFNIGRASIPATATGRDALAFGVMVNIPIWRSRLRAQVMQAKVKKAQVKARIEGLDSAFKTQISDLVSQMMREKDQMTLFQEALIPQAETTLQATLSSYATGRTDFLDLLDAERMLFSLQTGYEDAFARYMKATAALERALGVRSLSEIDSL